MNRNKTCMTRFCTATVRVDGGVYTTVLFSSPLSAGIAKVKSLLGITMRGLLVPAK